MSDMDRMQEINVDFSQFIKKNLKKIKMLPKDKQKEFGRLLGDFKEGLDNLSESNVNEGKNDFMAKHSGTNITLKKGYKHHTEDELTDLYNKIGELVKDDLKVKDVTIVFE